MPAHPLIHRLTREFGFPRLTTAEARATFVSAPGTHCLFIPGDPARDRETTDLAVILPELYLAFQKTFDCAVIDDAIETETRDAVAVHKTPSLIFFREGLQIGALPIVRDRTDLMARIAQILAARTASETPPGPSRQSVQGGARAAATPAEPAA
jgi:hydrogenase-1 operon protein HyaE